MRSGSFKKARDNIIELKTKIFVSNIEGEYLNLPEGLAKRLKGKTIEFIPEKDRILFIRV